MKHTHWYKDAIIYQIYPRSFKDTNNDGIGDIPGIISKLDYLKYLGITAIWLSPIYDSPQFDNGYDIADYCNVWKPFGTLDDMKKLISEAHNRNIKIIMDLVVNHTSDQHRWFKEAIKSKDNPYRDYYVIRKGKKNGKKPPNNWRSCFGGGPAWERIADSDEWYLHIFAKEQPDLNWENPKLRDDIASNLRFWLNLGVDGFRCDVITLLSKDQRFKNDLNQIMPGKKYYANGPRIHEFLHELYEKAYKDYDTMTVGETFMNTVKNKDALRYVNPNNEELDMIFNFNHVDTDNYFSIKYLYRKFKLNKFKKGFSKYQNLFEKNPGWNSLFIENHDQRRSAGRFNTDLGEYREKSAKSLATTYLFLRGTPFIYQGQEIGMQNMDYTSADDFKDIEFRNMYKTTQESKFFNWLFGKHMFEVSRDNARTPMQWDDSEYAGFSKATPWIKVNENKCFINVEASIKDPNSIFNYYKKLISLRKKYFKVIKNGTYRLLCKRNRNVFAYLREDDSFQFLVMSSFSKKKIKNPLRNKLNGYELLLANDDSKGVDTLTPYESRIYIKKKTN